MTAVPVAKTEQVGLSSKRRGRPVVGSLRASAQRIQLANRKVAKAQGGKRQEWQPESYEYFDGLGIVKNVLLERAALISKLRLYPAVRPIDDPEASPIPVTDPASGISPEVARMAQEEIARIRGAYGGTAEVLRLIDLNKQLAGELFVVCRGPRLTEEADDQGLVTEVLTLESWDVVSILECRPKNDGTYEVADELTGDWKPLEPDKGDMCVRFWQRHPGRRLLADCHMRAVLPDCEALVLLENELKAETKSRQSNNILAVPNTIAVMAPPQRTDPAAEDDDEDAIDDPPYDGDADAVTIGEVLEEAMLDPIEDPSSPWSVWPIIFIGPADDLKEIRVVDLNRKASDRLEERITNRKTAIAQGLPMPIEFAMGHMNTTFANAEQIDADIFEKYLEPDVGLYAEMWTDGLLQAGLEAAGVAPEIAERIIVWYDAGALTKDIDPADHVEQGMRLGLIGSESGRRYWGFSEDDAPEMLERILESILRQTRWDPAIVDAILQEADPSLPLPDPDELVPGGAAPPPSDQQQQAASAIELLRRPDLTRGQAIAGLLALQKAIGELRASATGHRHAPNHPGARLAAVDRDLMTKTRPLLNAAMGRALERAGNRLKTKAGPLRGSLRAVAPLYAAMQMGPAALRAAGVVDSELVEDDAFDGCVDQYRQWGAAAQKKALAVAATLGAWGPAKKQQVAHEQTAALADSADWMHARLRDLAQERLYQPDPTAPERGEFDISSRIPPGLVRTAIAIAGGATALEVVAGQTYAVKSSGKPPGGIGTGETLTAALLDDGQLIVEAYRWNYGQADRHRPFEPHELLDGITMESEVDFVTDAADSWLGDFYYPGDHDGCACEDLEPVYAQAPNEIAGGDAGTGLDAPDRGAPLFGEEH